MNVASSRDAETCWYRSTISSYYQCSADSTIKHRNSRHTFGSIIMSQSKLYQLESCPDELVDGVLGFVDHEALPALSLCSRRLHRLTERHLYSIFKQTSREAHALPNFLRTIMNKPHLADFVKHYIGAATNRRITATETHVAKVLSLTGQTVRVLLIRPRLRSNQAV